MQATPMDVTALLLFYRQRMEQDLQAQQLLFDISVQCDRLCSTPLPASDALLDSLLPPYSPTSLSSLSDCHPPTLLPPSSSPAPVHSGRGRHCLDVCISRYLDVSGYGRRRMGRTAEEVVRLDRLRERRRGKERERQAAALLAAAAAANVGAAEGPSSASPARGEGSFGSSASLTSNSPG